MDKDNLLLKTLAVLVGWNVAVVVFFVLATLFAGTMASAGYTGAMAKLLFLTCILVSIALGVFLAKKELARFEKLSTRWRLVCLAVLVVITVLIFPQPMMFIAS